MPKLLKLRTKRKKRPKFLRYGPSVYKPRQKKPIPKEPTNVKLPDSVVPSPDKVHLTIAQLREVLGEDHDRMYWILAWFERMGLTRKVGFSSSKHPGGGRPAYIWEFPKQIVINLAPPEDMVLEVVDVKAI